MLRDSSNEVGARAVRPRPRPLSSATRFAGHAVLLAIWALVIIMGVLTWGPHLSPFKTDVIIGQSMEPTIPLYSVIVVEPVAPEALRPGDVITFEQPELGDRKVTHRIESVERRKDGELAFVTKGDNNKARDPWKVTYADTGYRVRWHVPHVGWLMLQAQTPLARLLLVVLPVLLIFITAMRWIWGSWGVEDPAVAAQAEADRDAYGALGLTNDIHWDEWDYVDTEDDDGIADNVVDTKPRHVRRGAA